MIDSIPKKCLMKAHNISKASKYKNLNFICENSSCVLRDFNAIKLLPVKSFSLKGYLTPGSTPFVDAIHYVFPGFAIICYSLYHMFFFLFFVFLRGGGEKSSRILVRNDLVSQARSVFEACLRRKQYLKAKLTLSIKKRIYRAKIFLKNLIY